MKITEIQPLKTVTDLICNKCGSSLKIYLYNHNTNKEEPWNFCGLEEVSIEGVYNSKEIPDGTKYIFSLCEKCTKELIDSFKLPPEEICSFPA